MSYFLFKCSINCVQKLVELNTILESRKTTYMDDWKIARNSWKWIKFALKHRGFVENRKSGTQL